MRHRVAIGGIGIESSTFSPHRSTLDDFTVKRGDDLLSRYDFLDSEPFRQVDWAGLLHARSLPGGPVVPECYQALKAELLARLQEALPLDGVFLHIHGAMSVLGMTDAEGDLVTAVREAVGPRCLISAGMDLHGNVSRTFVSQVDLARAYRMAPHEDAAESTRRAAANLVTCLLDDVRPQRAWVTVPVLLPGERTSTRMDPAKSLYASLNDVDDRPGVIDAAIWVGYAWADEPRCRAAIVVSGTDAEVIRREARQLAQRYWQSRDDFGFGVTTASGVEAVAAGLASTRRPFLISDSGDNPTAGGAGDVPYMLRALLADPDLAAGTRSAINAAIADPDAVAACVAAGVGATVSLGVGGRIDRNHGAPVALHGRVHALHRDEEGRDVAVVQAGGVYAILTSRRKPYHRIADFTAVGLHPSDVDITVVKIGYLEPELHDVAADRILALTPGGVDQHLRRLPYRAVTRPIYPLDDDMPEPELEPELFPSVP